jgi:predicted ATPase
MIEQPELHLNPRVQQRLADFLLAVTASGRQLIVETHSEYLISRLRLRVALDTTNRVQQTVGLLFAERANGSTEYRQVETNEFGGLENWPANFFDQSAEEAQELLRAAVKKRRAQQSATPHRHVTPEHQE